MHFEALFKHASGNERHHPIKGLDVGSNLGLLHCGHCLEIDVVLTIVDVTQRRPHTAGTLVGEFTGISGELGKFRRHAHAELVEIHQRFDEFRP